MSSGSLPDRWQIPVCRPQPPRPPAPGAAATARRAGCHREPAPLAGAGGGGRWKCPVSMTAHTASNSIAVTSTQGDEAERQPGACTRPERRIGTPNLVELTVLAYVQINWLCMPVPHPASAQRGPLCAPARPAAACHRRPGRGRAGPAHPRAHRAQYICTLTAIGRTNRFSNDLRCTNLAAPTGAPTSSELAGRFEWVYLTNGSAAARSTDPFEYEVKFRWLSSRGRPSSLCHRLHELRAGIVAAVPLARIGGISAAIENQPIRHR